MQITTVIVTRNKSASVKTLHTLLKLNIVCLENNVHNRIMFTNDDFHSRKMTLQKNLKSSNRLLWIDYGIAVDEDSLRHVVARDWQWHGIVFPCVTEGINWEKFKEGIDTPEPLSQKGLEFDTTVDRKVCDDFYTITKTNPKCFVLETKPLLKNMKRVSHDFGELFSELNTTKFKLVAFTPAKLIVTYPHECLGNILGAAGVKANTA